MGGEFLYVRTVTLTDISPHMTLRDVIQMVHQRNDISNIDDIVLFHVKDKKEIQIKRIQQLRKLLKEDTDSVRLIVRSRDRSQYKRPAIVRAKKALMRLKNLFARETVHQQNNLNFTTSKNVNKAGVTFSKCSGEKLTSIENLLQSETLLMARCYEAEVIGKVELFRRFMNDVNDSINDLDGEGTFVDSSSIVETLSEATSLTANLNEGFLRKDSAVSLAAHEKSSDVTTVSSKLNKAFMRQPVELSLLNNAMLHTTTLQDTALGQDITESLYTNSTDLFNQCLVYDESRDTSDCSESAFGDDDDVEELERNVFDEDFESHILVVEDSSNTLSGDFDSLVDDVTNILDKSFVERTNEAIDSYMSFIGQSDEKDEGLSSIGTDYSSE